MAVAGRDERADGRQKHDRQHVEQRAEDAAQHPQSLAFLGQAAHAHDHQLQRSQGDRERPERPGKSNSRAGPIESGLLGRHYAAYAGAVPLRVILAEDNLLVREGVQRLLEAQPDVELVATCGDLDALLAAVERERPDVVITDIRMPPTGTDEGIRAAERLRATHPELACWCSASTMTPSTRWRSWKAALPGRAYLEGRVSHPDQLLAAVREVAHGGSVIDPKVVEALIGQRARTAISPLADLTPREREVLANIAQGKTNAAIAEALVLTPRAVEKHINVIFSKLPLDQQPTVDRRVMAVLLFLAETA